MASQNQSPNQQSSQQTVAPRKSHAKLAFEIGVLAALAVPVIYCATRPQEQRPSTPPTPVTAKSYIAGLVSLASEYSLAASKIDPTGSTYHFDRANFDHSWQRVDKNEWIVRTEAVIGWMTRIIQDRENLSATRDTLMKDMSEPQRKAWSVDLTRDPATQMLAEKSQWLLNCCEKDLRFGALPRGEQLVARGELARTAYEQANILLQATRTILDDHPGRAMLKLQEIASNLKK